MNENSTKNYLDVVPDFKDRNPLPMVDVSTNVLSLAKTITSSAIDLCRLNAQNEENHMKLQLLSDYNDKTFAIGNKMIDKYYEQADEAINYSAKIIDYGIATNNVQLMLKGLDVVEKIHTHNSFTTIPDFAKKLDNGEKLQLGYDEENENE